MWSFTRQTTDSSSQNIAAGGCNQQDDSNSSRISLRHFSGYPTEDPVRFLSDFDAYCKLSRINYTDGRKVAAFQLDLGDQSIRGTAASVKTIRTIGTIWWQHSN